MGNIVTEKKRFRIFHYKIIFKENYDTYCIVLFFILFLFQVGKKEKKNILLFFLFIDINNKTISKIQGGGG